MTKIKDAFINSSEISQKIIISILKSPKKIVSSEEIGKIIKKRAQALGGSFCGFKQSKIQLVEKVSKGKYRINPKYEKELRKLIEDL